MRKIIHNAYRKGDKKKEELYKYKVYIITPGDGYTGDGKVAALNVKDANGILLEHIDKEPDKYVGSTTITESDFLNFYSTDRGIIEYNIYSYM